MDRFMFERPSGGRLRIAMLVPPWYELPPPGYGGLEQMCAALVDSLVAKGHDVTVIGAGIRNGTLGRFISTMDEPQHLRLGEGLPELVHVARANDVIEDLGVDVVHDHTSAGLLTAPPGRHLRSRPSTTLPPPSTGICWPVSMAEYWPVRWRWWRSRRRNAGCVRICPGLR